jgi:hypothetical protein
VAGDIRWLFFICFYPFDHCYAFGFSVCKTLDEGGALDSSSE